MKKVSMLTIALLSIAAAGFAQDWTWDKVHSQLNFGITHNTINELDGSFGTVEAKMTASKEDLSDARITLTADVNSINTGNEARNNELKGDAFFNAAQYGTLSFTSTSFEKIDGKNYRLSGTLTLHGITKPVVLNVIFNGTIVNQMNKKTTAGFKVTGTIKRTDFGIAPDFPVNVVSDEVMLSANAEFVKS
jgi:polyisoprenoid-binding protein YceI